MLDNDIAIVEQSLALPCPSCGNELKYSADKQELSCNYCGYSEQIAKDDTKVRERDLAEALEQMKSYVPEASGNKVFKCKNCDAQFMIELDNVKVNCGFCGSTKVNLEAFEHRFIQPVGIIPFYISKIEAQAKFKEWIGRSFFNPSKLKHLAALEDLHGVYIPFWTFDAETKSSWSGEAGRYHTTTRMVNVKGRPQRQKVQEVIWNRKSGSLEHFFDDILVVGSQGLRQNEIERILPFRMEEVVSYDPRFLMGWETEIYRLEVDEAFLKAEHIMDFKIRNMCSAQLGGDTQRNLHVSSEKWGETFKHIILPIWIATYMYNNKIYHFMINGQTGRVYGKKPLSWVKIALLILMFVFFIVGVWYLRESGIFRR